MKLTIGRHDKADFPELELSDIDVKIDTGAYTSSIHCHHIKEGENENGAFVEFQLLDPNHSEYNNKTFKVKHFKKKSVKNSGGTAEERIIIKTNIFIFDTEFPIELSLTERSEMKFPVLLGRKLLKNRFVVDVSKKNLSFGTKKS